MSDEWDWRQEADLRAQLDTMRARAEKAEAERDEAHARIEAFLAGVKRMCSYCGTTLRKGDSRDAHMRACAKHPLAKAERERDEARARLEAAERGREAWEADVRERCMRVASDLVDAEEARSALLRDTLEDIRDDGHCPPPDVFERALGSNAGRDALAEHRAVRARKDAALNELRDVRARLRVLEEAAGYVVSGHVPDCDMAMVPAYACGCALEVLRAALLPGRVEP